jgi:hypothetical protein
MSTQTADIATLDIHDASVLSFLARVKPQRRDKQQSVLKTLKSDLAKRVAHILVAGEPVSSTEPDEMDLTGTARRIAEKLNSDAAKSHQVLIQSDRRIQRRRMIGRQMFGKK